jgi:hypothetical protein
LHAVLAQSDGVHISRDQAYRNSLSAIIQNSFQKEANKIIQGINKIYYISAFIDYFLRARIYSDEATMNLMVQSGMA